MTKKIMNLTHRSKVMEIKYGEAKYHGTDTIGGTIHWRKNYYDEFQPFYLDTWGEEKTPYIRFTTPLNLSKTMRKEVGEKLLKELLKES